MPKRAFVLLTTLIVAIIAVPTISVAVVLNASGQSLKFKSSSKSIISSGVGTSLVDAGKNLHDIVKYSDVANINGVAIDAIVTTEKLVDLTVNNYDDGSAVSASPPGSSQTVDDLLLTDVTAINATDSVLALRFQFFEGGTYTGPNTGLPVTLSNVFVNSYDIDGTQNNYKQFTDFKGFQSYQIYTESSTKGLDVVDLTPSPYDAQDPLGLNGVVRFIAKSGSSSASTTSGSYSWSRVQVKYEQLSELTVQVGVQGSGGAYYGLDFSASAAWATNASSPSATVTPTTSPNPGNLPPVTTDFSLYDPTGVGFTFRAADFPFTDADSNPFTSLKIVSLPTPGNGLLEYFNGTSWVSVTAGQVILVSDLDLGKLRLTGSATDSFTFQVNDGLAYSNTGTLNYTVVAQSQTINFTNPGPKTPSSTFASGATATSGLPVTLTSQTPGICSVSGLDITTITSGTCVIVATQPGNSTYGQAQAVIQQFPVSTLTPQTISFNNPGNTTFNSGGTISSGATTTSGLTPVLISNTPSVCTINGLDIIQVSAGICEIKATQPGNGTYSPASPVIQRFTLTTSSLQSQTITYNQPANQLLSSNTLTVAPTASSGLPVTLTSTTSGVCTVSGFVITFVSAGTCTTTASQAGNGTYSAATPVAQSFQITSSSLTAQTITLPNPGAQQLSSGGVTLSPSATSGLTVVLTSSTPNVCTVSGNVITFVGPGTCTITGNQPGNGTYSAAPAVTISFLVTGTSTPTVSGTPPQTPTLFTPRRTTPTPTPTVSPTPAASPAATPKPSVTSAAAAPSSSTATRSVGEIASEAISGFQPGSGLTVHVTGSRIAGQFVASPTTLADPIALAAAISESTARTQTDFAQVQQVSPLSTAPTSKQIFDTIITPKIKDVFAASGLQSPQTVADLPTSQSSNWLSVSAAVKGYLPGSQVYLVVTTKPTILAGVTVNSNGTASLEGVLPVDLLEAGGHNIRLVGTRTIDGVSTDENGEITLDDAAIALIKQFDEGTKATVVLAGTSAEGSSLSAIREVYLDKYIAWWTVWLAAGIALISLLLRFLHPPVRFGRRVTSSVLAFAGGVPAFIIGWLTVSYELWVGTGIALVVGAFCLLWGRLGGRRSRMND